MRLRCNEVVVPYASIIHKGVDGKLHDICGQL